MTTLSASDTTSPLNGQYRVTTGTAKNESLWAMEREAGENRRAWSNIIDRKLIEWGRDPTRLEDEDVVPPSFEAIKAASDSAMALRDKSIEAPKRVVPNGDGGIVFERWEGSVSETIEVFEDGSIEYCRYRDTRLTHRQRRL